MGSYLNITQTQPSDTTTKQTSMSSRPDRWHSAVSHSTGRKYFHNPARRLSLWHDDSLPEVHTQNCQGAWGGGRGKHDHSQSCAPVVHLFNDTQGWAWGKEGEHKPKFYYNMTTNTKSHTRPSAAAAAAAASHRASTKRKHEESTNSS